MLMHACMRKPLPQHISTFHPIRRSRAAHAQVMKIAVAPTVIAMELVMFGRLPGPRVIASVLVVCMGIAVATVSDSQMIRNLFGIAVGCAATVMTALYQIWAGSKQKELKASSMQLLHAYTPQAAIMLGILIPIFEPMGWSSKAEGTLLGYNYSFKSVAAILISAALGLMVSLSTFLVIGATSSLTYNVVGEGAHASMKTYMCVCVCVCDACAFREWGCVVVVTSSSL